MDFSMNGIDIAESKALIEQVTRKLLFVELVGMEIDVTSKVGLRVIDNFRLDLDENDGGSTAYTADQIYDFIERMEL